MFKDLEKMEQYFNLAKKAPPEFSEKTMHKLKREHGTESAFKIAWAAHNKKIEKADDKTGEIPSQMAQQAAPNPGSMSGTGSGSFAGEFGHLMNGPSTKSFSGIKPSGTAGIPLNERHFEAPHFPGQENEWGSPDTSKPVPSTEWGHEGGASIPEETGLTATHISPTQITPHNYGFTKESSAIHDPLSAAPKAPYFPGQENEWGNANKPQETASGEWGNAPQKEPGFLGNMANKVKSFFKTDDIEKMDGFFKREEMSKSEIIKQLKEIAEELKKNQ